MNLTAIRSRRGNSRKEITRITWDLQREIRRVEMLIENWKDESTSIFKTRLKEVLELFNALGDDDILASILRAIEVIGKSLESGGKILIMGNGGSAADSQHMAAELVGAFKDKWRKGLPAIALTTDTSVLTSISNDYGYEKVFLKQVEAVASEGDVIFLISTSGNSRNLVEVGRYCREKGLRCVALLGKGGGRLKGICDAEIIVPSSDTPRIQEAHIFIIHFICEMLERYFKKGSSGRGGREDDSPAREKR